MNNPYNDARDRRKQDNSRLYAIADSAFMLALTRFSAPMLVGISSWILITVLQMHTELATSSFIISNHENRINHLEMSVYHIPGSDSQSQLGTLSR